MHNKPFLSFYEEKNIIPVRQDISDRAKHFRRRGALFLHLGIIPAMLGGKSVLEFGPGSGDNAVFTASLSPTRYLLVDGNAASISAIQEKRADGTLPAATTEVVKSEILKFETPEKFDFVFCEGVIPGQVNPHDYLRHIASFATPGGCVTITTISAISAFADICRRMVKPHLVSLSPKFDTVTAYATELFGSHLDTLNGMSRLHQDWVLDNIMNPWTRQGLFSIGEAIETLKGEFDVYGSSPKFLTDWRWYKSIVEPETGINNMAKLQYAELAPVFINHRLSPEESGIDNPARLAELCQTAYDVHVPLWQADDSNGVMQQFIPIVEDIIALFGAPNHPTASALADYVAAMRRAAAGERFPDMGAFKSLFGRGQQYVSFVRKSGA